MSERFVNAARSYVGVPWEHLGRSRKGVDCVGLPVLAAADCGVKLKDVKVYKRTPHNGQLRKRIEEALGKPIPRASWVPGDIVMIRMDGHEHHVAILSRYEGGYLGFGLIHASGEHKTVIETILDERFYRSRIACGYRSPA